MCNFKINNINWLHYKTPPSNFPFNFEGIVNENYKIINNLINLVLNFTNGQLPMTQ